MKFEKGDKVKNDLISVTVTGPGMLNGTFAGVVMSCINTSYKVGEYSENFREAVFEKIEDSSNKNLPIKFKQGDYVNGKSGIIVLVVTSVRHPDLQYGFNSFSGVVIKQIDNSYAVGEYREDWIPSHFEKINFDPVEHSNIDKLKKHLEELRANAVDLVKQYENSLLKQAIANHMNNESMLERRILLEHRYGRRSMIETILQNFPELKIT